MSSIADAVTRRAPLTPVLAVLGPGLMVMLADTDAGSIVTAAQSGARRGYRLLLLQLLLVPVLMLALGIGGAALVASIVVALALAWAVAEAAGKPRSLDNSPRRAPLFYGLFTAAVVFGAALVLVSNSLVRLAIEVEILNALLLPLVLGFLALLAHRVLPRPYALGRRRRTALAATLAAVTAIGLLWVGLPLGV